MHDVPGCIRERRYSITHLLPTSEAWAASQSRASAVARIAVKQGYRVVGHGKNWRVVLDPMKSRLLNT
jgi:hypothetical protein